MDFSGCLVHKQGSEHESQVTVTSLYQFHNQYICLHLCGYMKTLVHNIEKSAFLNNFLNKAMSIPILWYNAVCNTHQLMGGGGGNLI